MSLNQPTPNNLTIVRFGPLAVDFTTTGSYTLGQLEYDENVFVPTNAFIVYSNVVGPASGSTQFSTGASVNITDSISGQNIVAATTLPVTGIPLTSPANTAVTSGGTTLGGNASQTILSLVGTSSPGYILGGLPLADQLPYGASPISPTGSFPVASSNAGGAASVQKLTFNVTTAAVPSVTVSSSTTTNNITTLTLSALPASFVAGAVVNVLGVGAGYNGTVTILSASGSTITYYNPSIASGTTGAGGTVGSLAGNVYVAGYLF
jgi:hypothetical protein